jgi:hypothetical protein
VDPFDLLVLQIVARGGIMVQDQITDRIAQKNARELFGRPRSLEASLKRLQIKGYLELRPVVYSAATAAPGNGADVAIRVGKKVYDRAYYVTQRASGEFNMALPPSVRESFLEHHLKTLDAAFRVERRSRDQGCEILSFRLESDLIRERFSGITFDHEGITLGKFPDAILAVRHPDGREESINIEYVSSKYTDEMIREKHDQFPGTTVWAASNEETARRVERLTEGEVLLV